MGTTIAGWFNHLDDTSQVDNGWCKNHPNKNTVFHHIKEVDWLSYCSLLMVLIYPIIYCMTIYYICIYRIIDPQLHPKQWQKAIITKEVSCLVPSTLPRYPFSAAKKTAAAAAAGCRSKGAWAMRGWMCPASPLPHFVSKRVILCWSWKLRYCMLGRAEGPVRFY